jgi:hypothetical protein
MGYNSVYGAKRAIADRGTVNLKELDHEESLTQRHKDAKENLT